MATSRVSFVGPGARLLWRRQRVLWGVYAVNFLLALMGALPVALYLGRVLNRSLAAERLYKAFDLSLFVELITQPDVSLSALLPGSFLLASLFLVAMVFLSGGVLEAYRCDRRLGAGEFFQACGAFFWRFVRLLVFLLAVLVPIGLLFNLAQQWSGRLSADAPWEMLGFWVGVGGTIVVLFLLLAVRLWFDMAQVCAVAESEHKMRRALVRAFRLTFGNFAQLFWIYLRILLVAAVGLAMALWLWVRFVRPEWVAVSFLLGQAVVAQWLATRLWLRASETLWYQHHSAAPPPEPSTASAPNLAA